MAGTMFWSQKQMMARNAAQMADNPMAQQQKVLLYVMPLFLGFISLNFPMGMLLYWVTTNFWQVAQQAIILREVQHEVETGTLADHRGGEAAAKKGKGNGPTPCPGKPRSGSSKGKGSGAPDRPSSRPSPKGPSKGATSGGAPRDGEKRPPTSPRRPSHVHRRSATTSPVGVVASAADKEQRPMSRRTDARGATFEEALVSAIAELVDGEPEKVELQLRAPGLDDLQGRIRIDLEVGGRPTSTTRTRSTRRRRAGPDERDDRCRRDDDRDR
jgi:hypothetical protein